MCRSLYRLHLNIATMAAHPVSWQIVTSVKTLYLNVTLAAGEKYNNNQINTVN